MGLFGPSKTELEERIAELEDALDEKDERVNDLSTRVRNVEGTADRAERKAYDALNEANEAQENAEQHARTAIDLAQALNQHDTEDAGELEDLNDVVQTIEEPKIVWKATRSQIAKLLLPEGTTVVHPNGDSKRRGDQAIVLEFYDVEQTTKRGFHSTKTARNVSDNIALETTDTSMNTSTFEYEVGERVTPDNGDLDTNTHVSCTRGIHFFRTKDEALDWYMV